MKKLLAALLCTAVLGVSGPVAAAHATPHTVSGGDESSFVSHINALRTSKGLRPLQVSGTITAVARSWSAHMAAAGQISHNPDLVRDMPGDWRTVGENVGVGYDVDSLWRAFVASPEHYANLIDPDYTLVGVGDVWAPDGRLFTTHDFEGLAGGGSPPPPPTGVQKSGTTHRSTSATHSSTTAPPPPAAPAPPPPPPAAPVRVSTVLAALHALGP